MTTHLTQTRLLISLGIGIGLTAVSGLTYLYLKYMKRERIPLEWKIVGQLEDMNYYPIKSCGAVKLYKAKCENLGINESGVRDRSLMLIDQNAQMISARTYPKMFKIIPNVIDHSKLLISAPGMKDIEFDFSTIGSESDGNIQVTLYGFNVTVLDCGEKYHKWFSQYILGKNEGLWLVYYPFATPTRPILKEFINGVFTKEDTGALQDVSSYMLINNSSVDDLNKRLKNTVIPQQFRGIFCVTTCGEPYDEDNWEWIKIGDALFRNLAPCYRCIMPNIHPSSCERDPDGEPLKTLKTYRVLPHGKSKSPSFGIQLGLRSAGTVKLGDYVYVGSSSK